MSKKKIIKQTVLALIVLAAGFYILLVNISRHNQATHGINDVAVEADAVNKSKSNSNDLLYREIQGPSISLEPGEKINISVAGENQYKDVFIYLIGTDVVQQIGTLDSGTPFSFKVTVSGEYVIYAGTNGSNITNEVMVEYSKEINDTLLSPLKGFGASR